MPRKKKPFIDRKETVVSYHLVHSSQEDPPAADKTAPQNVLLQPPSRAEMEKRREEQRLCGVYFDDDYDYIQHLKELKAAHSQLLSQNIFVLRDEGGEEEEKEGDVDQTMPIAAISLPPSVAASEDLAPLYKAAPITVPGLDMDPDLLAGLDDNFDFEDPENVLDEDFIAKANDVM